MQILEVYTSRINHKGEGRLDVTIKSGDKTFAPTWSMVIDYKNGKITEEQYKQKYNQLMRKSYIESRSRWEEVLNSGKVVLCCYCKSGEFCHRYILADIMVKLGARYCGEV